MSNRQASIEAKDLVSDGALSRMKQVEDSLERINKLSNQLKGQTIKLGDTKDLRSQEKILRNIKDLRQKITTEQKKQYEAQKKINKEANKQKKNIGEVNRGYKKSNNLLKQMGKLVLVAFGVDQLVQFVKNIWLLVRAYDQMHFTMRTIIQDTYDLIGANAFLIDITKKYGLSLRVVTQQYVKFRAAAKSAGLTTLEMEKIFDSTSKAAAIMGLRSDELRGVYLALEQMLSKGKVTTEELRRQLGERLPGAFNIMAKAVGVTTAELDKMLKKGEIISAEVLPAFADQLEKEYKIESIEEVNNLNSQIQKLTTNWELFVTTLFNSQGKVVQGILKIAGAAAKLLEILTEISEDPIQRADRIAEERSTQTQNKELKERNKLEKEYIDLLEKGNVKEEEKEELIKKWRQSKRDEAKVELKRLKEQLEREFGENSLMGRSLKEAQDLLERKGFKKSEVDENGMVSLDTETSPEQRKKNIESAELTINRILEQRAKILGDIAAFTKLAEDPTASTGTTDTTEGRRRRLFKEKDLTGSLEKEIELLKIKMDLNKQIYENEDNDMEARQRALDRYWSAQEDLLNTQRTKELQARERFYLDEKSRAEKALKDKSDFLNKDGQLVTYNAEYLDSYLKRLEKDFLDWKLKINEDYDDQIATNSYENAVESEQIKIQAIQRLYEQNQRKVQSEFDQSVIQGGQDISGRKTLIGKIQASNRADQTMDWQSLQRDIASAEAELGKYEQTLQLIQQSPLVAPGDDILIDQLKAKIIELKKKLAELSGDSVDTFKEDLITFLNNLGQINDAIGGLFDAFHERRMSQIEAEQEAEDKKYKQLQKLAEDDADRQEALANQKEIIDERLEAKRRKAERDNAIREKAQALASIAINTAVAATKVIGQTGLFGIPLLPIVLTLGAIQAATVLAQPLPRLKTGRKDGPATYAVVGDGGRREVIEKKDGSIGITPDKDTITWLDKGDKVYKSEADYKRNLMQRMTKEMVDDALNQNIEDAIERGFKKAKIHNKIVNKNNIDISSMMWQKQQSQQI